jgi:hypothetical protein
VTTAPAPTAGTGEEGASPITSLVGVAVFLSFLFLAVQVLLYLFTASVVQAAAVDGASHGAGAAQAVSTAEAETRASAVLGRLADGATVRAVTRADVSGEVLVVDVEVQLPSLLGAMGLARIERSASARVEQ